MKLQLVKMIIPRQKSENGHPVAVTILPEKCEKPVHRVLLAMLGRLYNNERKVNTSP